MRRIIEGFDGRLRFGAAAAGVVLMAGLAGWGGSTIALANADTPSSSPAEGRSVAGPAASAPTAATTTQPASPSALAAAPASTSSSPARTTRAAPPPAVSPSLTTPAGVSVAAAPPLPQTYEMDLAFVSPWRDSVNGQWNYGIGLLGFPADTVVEISGSDSYGNPRVGPLVMTTAEGSWNPYTTGFGMSFAYGGTCEAAEPATVTARGTGFSVTETAPRPPECDGGATPDGPWTRPVLPTPVRAPVPTIPPPSTNTGGS